MEVEFQNTKKDYIDFYKLQLKAVPLKRGIIFIIPFFFIVSAVYNEHWIWWRSILYLIVYAIIFACLFYFLPLLIVSIKINKAISKEKAYLSKRKYTITEDGLMAESLDSTTLRKWTSIISTGINERFIFLKLADKKLLIIPKSAFISEVAVANFLGEILKHCTANINSNLNFDLNHIPIDKPNYKWGFLCLVPLIGGVNGVIMILMGIFKYKDIKYALLGLGGILVTVAVYAPLVYMSNKGSAFIEVSKMEMNSLVKEIEFYKIQNGSYPDSLRQLNTSHSFINLQDPIENAQKNSSYNYHKINNKYTLFSSGVDHLPNTADDIYPTIDTAKTGLIIK